MSSPNSVVFRWLSAGVSVLCLVLAGCASGSSNSSGSTTTTPVSGAPAATPAITAVSPTNVPAGSGDITLVVTGTNFTNGLAVVLNGVTEPTTYTSSTELRAAVAAAQLKTGSVLSVAVSSSGTVTAKADPTITSLSVDNPVPSLASVSPAAALLGSADTTVTVTGTNFVQGVALAVNGTTRVTTYVSDTKLTAQLLASDFTAAGTLPLNVINPKPGGGTSTTVPFVVSLPPATLTAISPTVITSGSTATITLTGSNFTGTTTVYVNDVPATTTVVSSTALTFVPPAALTKIGGSLRISVRDPAQPNYTSNGLALQVSNPVPTLSAVNPQTILSGSSDTTITLIGSGFNPSTLVSTGSTGLVTSYISSTQLTALLPKALLGSAGTLSFTVINPAPGGGSTQGVGITIAPPPLSLVSLSPASINIGSTATISVSGANFTSTTSVLLNGTTVAATNYISSTSLEFTVPSALSASTGTVSVSVLDSSSPGTTANSLSLNVQNPLPVISALAPQSVLPGSSDTTVTLTGAGFVPSSAVLAGSAALPTTFVSSNQITAVIPAAMLATSSSVKITVMNPTPGGGTSQSITFSIRQPIPTLQSVSPSSLVTGVSATVTITGSYFTPTTVAYLYSYLPLTTTFLSSTSLQITVPATASSSVGSISLQVRDPASQNYPSNSVTLSIVNPLPVLNSLSIGTVTAGSPNFTLTLSGTNFVQNSSVLINGVQTQPNLFPTSTSASVVVPATALSAVGTVSIAVTNPAPGGGASAALQLTVISANNRLRTLDIGAADLGWDVAHGLILVSTYSSSKNNPNSLVEINPVSGAVVAAQALSGPPAGLAVAADGSFVYVTLPSTGQVQRFTLPSLVPDILWDLGKDSNGNPLSTTSIAVAPGQPRTVVVSRNGGVSPNYFPIGNSLVIYDDGVARADSAVPSGAYGSYDTPVWSNNPGTLYATNAIISTAPLDTFAVTGAGVSLQSLQPNSLGEFVKHLKLDAGTNRLIDGYGHVVDPSTRQLKGQYQVQNTITYEENTFAIDAAQRSVYFLNNNGFYTSGALNGTYIQSFDADHFNYINSILVPGLTGASTLVRWGTSGLAMNGSSQIYLLDGSFVSPSGPTSTTGSYVAASPILNLVSPVFTTAGSPDVQVTLTGTNFTQASQVTWNNQLLAINSVSSTQIVATIPASSLASPIAGSITVSNGPGTGPSSPVAFSVLPDLGTTAAVGTVNVSGQDMVWDPQRSLLYVAVPSTDAALHDTISVVDPATLNLKQAIPTIAGPWALGLSDDAQYLYSGSISSATIQRYMLPAFTPDLSIPTGAGSDPKSVGTVLSCTFPIDVKVAPGHPQEIAVTSGNINFETQGCGGVAIYDGAVVRPNRPSTNYDFTNLAWGTDDSTLFAQSWIGIQSQGLLSAMITSQGVGNIQSINGGSLGKSVHYDPVTNLLYSDSGVITDPVRAKQVGSLPLGYGSIVTVDAALKRIFVLAQSSSFNPSWRLDVYDLNTYALLDTIALPGISGYPERMTRWGSDGIAFVTAPSGGLAGALYVLHGSRISGQR